MQISKQISNAILAFAFLAALLVPLLGYRQLASAVVDTCTWIGGTDTNFNTAANWSCSVDGTAVPEAGDTLQFTQIATSTTTTALTNDIGVGDTEFAGIIIDVTENTAGVIETYEIDTITLANNAPITTIGTTGDTGVEIYSYNMNLNGDLTVSAAASDVIYWYYNNLIGSGTVTIQDNATGVIISSSFTGDLVIGDNADVTVRGNNVEYPQNSISVGASTLIFDMYQNNTTPEITVPLTVDTTSLVFNMAQWYDTTWQSGPTDYTYSGPVTLNGNLLVRPSTNVTVNFTGTITKNNNVMKWDPYATGEVNVGGKELVPEPITIAEADKTTDSVVVSKNEVVTLNGERGSAYIYDGGTLKGSGTITGAVNIADGGVIAPGLSPGCLTIGGNLTMTGEYEFELEGETVCTEYDQIDVGGDVDITSASISLSRLASYVPELNTEFIIINNDGSNDVTGEFGGWAQGAQIVVDQVTYEIDYAGGDGNDVVLTVVAIDSELAAEADTPDTGLQTVLASPYVGLVAVALSAGTLAVLRQKKLI